MYKPTVRRPDYLPMTDVLKVADVLLDSSDPIDVVITRCTAAPTKIDDPEIFRKRFMRKLLDVTGQSPALRERYAELLK